MSSHANGNGTARFLPAPVRRYETFSDQKTPKATSQSAEKPSVQIPRYPNRLKARFVPRKLEDFGDGGAFPEIHLAQFPLNMGKKHSKKGGSSGSSASGGNTLALQVRGEDGKVSYDAIVTQHHRDKKKVYTGFQDMVEKDQTKPLALPSKDEEIETANRTKEALQSLIQGKIAAAHPVNVSRQKTAKESSTYIRYTPNDQGKMDGDASNGSRQRIIRMVEVAKDPMEPPKFQHKKAVRGPPSPPVPVLHSPPRKLTIKDQQSWKIPPCISNWKNSKGFTIALDKRLAADGRGLQQVTVNDNFASLSEALAIAERKAREEVNLRAQVQKKLVMKEKEMKENELRELASKARMERAGIMQNDERREDSDDDDDKDRRRGRSRRDHSRSRSRSRGRGRGRGRSHSDEDNDDDAQGIRERERIRQERKKEREREMRMEKLGRKGKLARDEDRDISEKIALGQLGGKASTGGDGMFDSRLFNQSQGMDSGFGHDDEYNVYSKPLVDRGKASVYRPQADASDAFGDADKEYEELKTKKRFRADKGFRGAESAGVKRDGPVQFSYDDQLSEEEEEEERSKKRSHRRPTRSHSRSRSRSRTRSRSSSRDRDRKRTRHDSRRSDDDDDDDDPFGLDQFLTDARKGRDAMDNIGRRNRQGVMSASAGGGVDRYADDSSSGRNGRRRDRLEFQSSRR